MKRSTEGTLTIIIPEGDIQGERVALLDETLEGLLAESINRIALDMEKVGYVYSQGIGILLKYQKKLTSNGGGLFLFNLRQTLRRILMEVNLLEYLNGYSTKEEMEFEMGAFEPSTREISLELGLHFEVKSHQGPRATIDLGGTIDSEKDLNQLRLQITALIKEGVSELQANLSELIYLDDLAVLELLGYAKQFKGLKGQLTLLYPNEIILDQFEIMGVSDHFNMIKKKPNTAS